MFPNRPNLHPGRSTTRRKAPPRPRPPSLLRPRSRYEVAPAAGITMLLPCYYGWLCRQEKKVTFQDDCKAEGNAHHGPGSAGFCSPVTPETFFTSSSERRQTQSGVQVRHQLFLWTVTWAGSDDIMLRFQPSDWLPARHAGVDQRRPAPAGGLTLSPPGRRHPGEVLVQARPRVRVCSDTVLVFLFLCHAHSHQDVSR